MENLIECKISKEDLKTLYEKLCVDPDTDHDCDKCILRNIKWQVPIHDEQSCKPNKPVVRDLCFAIHHDAILTDNPKHYHHSF